jgi:hypothetical protein
MTRTWRAVVGLVVVAALAGLATVTPGAGQADVAERLLQEALTQEVVEQDVAAAIRLYEQVIAMPGAPRAAVARARERVAALRGVAAAEAGTTSPAPGGGDPRVEGDLSRRRVWSTSADPTGYALGDVSRNGL